MNVKRPNTRRLPRHVLVVALLAALAAPAAAAAQAGSPYEGAAALGLDLRRLGTTKRVLMIGAHPDDENTSVLAALALGQGADVAYLSLTRGEGGQNVIGPELQEGLGLIRTEELLAARRIDGARQFFSRAYDFGFSKTAAETFDKWSREAVLADVVLVIRQFRPDVILSIWSGTPADGHGHHQAAGILAREAFEAAADPARFADQLARGLRPHRAVALYQASWRGGADATLRIETGTFDPLFGRSHHQLAMASRSRHRSQDQGSLEAPGPQSVGLIPLAGETRSNITSLFTALDTTLAAHARAARAASALVAAAEAFEREIRQATTSFNPLRPAALVPALGRALAALRQADSLAAAARLNELQLRIRAELDVAERALARAAGIEFDAVASDDRVVPGDTFTLELRVWNGGDAGVRISELAPVLPAGWAASPDEAPAGRAGGAGARGGQNARGGGSGDGSTVAPGTMLTRRFRVRVADNAAVSEPYFLRAPRAEGIYVWPADTTVQARPFEPPAIRGRVALELGGQPVGVERAATFVHVDGILGEERLPVLVVPAVSVRVEPGVDIVPIAADSNGGAAPARDVVVTLRSEATGGLEGGVRLRLPDGWAVEPERMPVRFAAAGEQVTARFRVTPPAGLAPGRYTARAEFETAGRRFDRGYQAIDYPHTEPRLLFRDAAVAFSAFPVATVAGLRIGYIEGAGDAGIGALRQLGYTVTPIEAERLTRGDLSVFDVIVAGIRAWEVRPDLVASNRRLLDWVRAGGTLIVQYNRQAYVEAGHAPYPLEMARSADRVTDETATVRLLDPSHPLLSRPNRIGAPDFEGWVQERGLYFMREWDERYTPLLEMNDPGEPPRQGSLLVAKYGEGTYIYVALSLFRQLPEGVPGAYRLLANLVAAGAN